VEPRSRPPLGAIRVGLGLTQAELAARAGYARPTLSRIETGDLKAWPRFRRAVAEAIGAPEAVIFGRDADRR
jgi:transcriptional regulator with XRE-family HTH domain